MSRIEDDGSDLRNREITEAQTRQRLSEEKRGVQSRLEKSFQQVMSERGKKEGETQAQQHTATKDGPKPKNVLEHLKKDGKLPSDLAKRAALAKMTQQALTQKRAAGAQEDQQLAATRSDEILNKSIDDRDALEKDVREHDEKGALVHEEKEALVKREANQHEGPVERRKDGERGQQQRRDRDDEAKANAVGAAKGPQGSAPPTIPKELIDKLVAAIQTSVNPDGRTSMTVTLKGGMLEGVQLNIQAENGKVSCEMSNCSDQLKKLARGSKEALKSALGKRNLTLVKFEVRGA